MGGLNIIDSITKSPAELSPVEFALWLQRQGGTTFELTASVPADNEAVLANPMMGLETGYGLTSPALLTSAITGVDTGAKTVTVNNANWYGLVADVQFPHFDSEYNWVGVLEVVTVASPVVYSVVSGSDPVVGGFILKHEIDFTLCRCKFSWKEIEAIKDTYDFTAIEKSSGIKVIRELNAHSWGKPKKFILNLICDYPTGSAHRDIPDWLHTETSADGVAYTITQGQGYSPDYSNATYIAAHGRLIAALGTQYATDPLFVFAQIGSIGHYGENWIDSTIHATQPFPNNTVVNQYLTQYADAFTAPKCITRRSLGDSGTLGMGLYNHGYYVMDQVYKNEEGAVDGFTDTRTDDYGYTQAAITDYKSRFKTGEPFGTSNSATNDYAFSDEPTSIITEAMLLDSSIWESGLYGQTVGSAVSPSANTAHFRLKVANKQAVTGGASYTFRRRNGVSGTTGGGYRVRLYQIDATGNLTKYTGGVNDLGTVTMEATTTHIVISLDMDRSPQLTMAYANVIDADPRIYLTSAGLPIQRNIHLVMKELYDYNLNSFSFNPSEWRVAGTHATQANIERFMKYVGYRLRPITATLASQTMTVTLKNDGNSVPFCGERRLSVGLFTGTTLVKSWESSARVDDVAANGGTKAIDVVMSKVKKGTYTIAIGLGVPSGVPDISLPATVLTGNWYAIGDITVS